MKRAEIRVAAVMLANPLRWFYATDLARLAKVRTSTAMRITKRWIDVGRVHDEWLDGRRVYCLTHQGERALEVRLRVGGR